MKIHHIGYAVADLAVAERDFALLGWSRCGDIVQDESRKVGIVFLHNGDYVVELVAPLSGDSPIKKVLLKQKGSSSPYHICYEADSLDTAAAGLVAQGFVSVVDPADAPAIGGRRVQFLFSRAVGLVELVEKEDPE